MAAPGTSGAWTLDRQLDSLLQGSRSVEQLGQSVGAILSSPGVLAKLQQGQDTETWVTGYLDRPDAPRRDDAGGWRQAGGAILCVAPMPRQRYRQDPLPIGPDAPAVELFGPEQPNPPGLQVVEQGQLGVVPLGPLFDESRDESRNQGADVGSTPSS